MSRLARSAARLRDRLHAGRDRLLASDRFRRFAHRMPLTRPIARRRAGELFDLCAGFVYSQILFACVRLRLPEQLADAPLTPADLASRLDLPLASTERLLDAAAALRLVERRSAGRYGLGELGAVLTGMPAVSAMVEHHAVLYDDLSDPVALLRQGRGQGALSAYWPYAEGASPESLDGGHVAPYSELMTASLSLVAEEVLDAVSLGRRTRLVDVGGGEGRFLEAAARRWPQLEGVLVDLPAVAGRAAERFRAAGLAGRLAAVPADFHRDDLPGGCDAASLIRVVHDHDDAEALALLTRVLRALEPGGVLVVAEPMAGERGPERVGNAYFGIYLFAMGRGRPRRPREIRALMRRAGFEGVRAVATATPLQARVVIGYRPSVI